MGTAKYGWKDVKQGNAPVPLAGQRFASAHSENWEVPPGVAVGGKRQLEGARGAGPGEWAAGAQATTPPFPGCAGGTVNSCCPFTLNFLGVWEASRRHRSPTPSFPATPKDTARAEPLCVFSSLFSLSGTFHLLPPPGQHDSPSPPAGLTGSQGPQFRCRGKPRGSGRRRDFLRVRESKPPAVSPPEAGG